MSELGANDEKKGLYGRAVFYRVTIAIDQDEESLLTPPDAEGYVIR